MHFTPAQISQIRAGAKIAAGLPWGDALNAALDQEWTRTAELTAEDVLTAIQPLFPQARVAKMIVHSVFAFVGAMPASGKPITAARLLEALSAAAGIDWTSLAHAMAGHRPDIAAWTILADLSAIAAAIDPAITPVAWAFEGLLIIGEHATPGQPGEPAMDAAAGSDNVSG
jgi:hypothetical protein